MNTHSVIPEDYAHFVDVPPVRVLFFDHAAPAIEHDCKIFPDGSRLRCAPYLQSAHKITGDAASLTIHPSILCPDCGLHGFIQKGRWIPA